MTSQLFFKVNYMLANFWILSNTLPFKYFLLNVYFEGNLDSANKFVNMTSKLCQITSLIV